MSYLFNVKRCELYGLGAIQVLRNTMGVGCIRKIGDQHFKGACSSVISVTREVGGVKLPEKSVM